MKLVGTTGGMELSLAEAREFAKQTIEVCKREQKRAEDFLAALDKNEVKPGPCFLLFDGPEVNGYDRTGPDELVAEEGELDEDLRYCPPGCPERKD